MVVCKYIYKLLQLIYNFLVLNININISIKLYTIEITGIILKILKILTLSWQTVV